jgi:DNA-binding response OmpR family regulator
MKILIVDDDPTTRKLIGLFLKAKGYAVAYAENGLDGIEKIGMENPNLIITDLSMPEMDGFKMIRRLKMQSAAINATIIVVTVLTASEIEAQGGLPPGIPVYPKPIPFAALRPLVEHLVRRVAA